MCLPPEVAREVVRGGRAVCDEAGIPLAGGHSIDAPEPIFGLAVTGVVDKRHLKRNDTATAGCRLYLTKPLGIGILTTAEKKAKLRPQDVGLARDWMCTLNRAGSRFGKLAGVTAMTDVTGFGLLGHLVEMADGSGLSAWVQDAAVPACRASSTTWPRAVCRAAPAAISTAMATRWAPSPKRRNSSCVIRRPAAGCWWP
jgi:selenide,water dikinase